MAKDPNERVSASSRRRRRPSSQVADWTACDAAILREAICSVALKGGALRLGYTSDGGAYAIGVYGDGDPYTDYVKPAEDITQFMRDIVEAWST